MGNRIGSTRAVRKEATVPSEVGLDALPDELLHLILWEGLDVYDQVAPARTCRRWRGLLLDAIRRRRRSHPIWAFTATVDPRLWPQCYRPESTPDRDDYLRAMAFRGHTRLVEWGRLQGFPLDRRCAYMAACGGHLDLLKSIYDESGGTWHDAAEGAAAHGHTAILDWIVEYEHMDDLDALFGVARDAAIGGHSMCAIEWLDAHGCRWDVDAFIVAVREGHLDVIEWLHAHGCPWDERVAIEAAYHDSAAILQWLRAHGCPWNGDVTLAAALNGRIAVLQWAFDHGCPWQKQRYLLFGGTMLRSSRFRTAVDAWVHSH